MFTILARQAPVARDLRAVLAGMRNVADLQPRTTLRHWIFRPRHTRLQKIRQLLQSTA